MQTLTKITDHVAQAKARLLTQYADKQTFLDLTECLTSGIQKLEDVFYSLLSIISIEDSEGIQLDNIGYVVGQLRNGLDDPEYKIFIYGRIAANLSKGTPEELISIFSLLTNATLVTYQEIYPASFSVMTDGTIIAGLEDQIKEILNIAAAGGVGLSHAGIYEGTPFIISSLYKSVSDSEGLGVSSLADMDQGVLAKLI